MPPNHISIPATYLHLHCYHFRPSHVSSCLDQCVLTLTSTREPIDQCTVIYCYVTSHSQAKWHETNNHFVCDSVIQQFGSGSGGWFFCWSHVWLSFSCSQLTDQLGLVGLGTVNWDSFSLLYLVSPSSRLACVSSHGRVICAQVLIYKGDWVMTWKEKCNVTAPLEMRATAFHEGPQRGSTSVSQEAERSEGKKA